MKDLSSILAKFENLIHQNKFHHRTRLHRHRTSQPASQHRHALLPSPSYVS